MAAALAESLPLRTLAASSVWPSPASAFISRNLARRHMGPGARAMIVAMMYPEPVRGGNRKGQTQGSEDERFPMTTRLRPTP
jgi:hypothetical protein